MLIPIIIYFLLVCFAALIVLSACAATTHFLPRQFTSEQSGVPATSIRMAATLAEGTARKLVTRKCGRTMTKSEDRGDSRKDGNPFSASSPPNGAGGRSALNRPSRARSPLLPDPAIAFGRLLAMSKCWRRVA